MQRHFNPINYGFTWTADWYVWDSPAAHKEARRSRDAVAKELRTEGKTVVCSTNRNQLISRGGIGSGHPHIEQIVSVYMLEVVSL